MIKAELARCNFHLLCCYYFHRAPAGNMYQPGILSSPAIDMFPDFVLYGFLHLETVLSGIPECTCKPTNTHGTALAIGNLLCFLPNIWLPFLEGQMNLLSKSL